jgi:hypothetical protein
MRTQTPVAILFAALLCACQGTGNIPGAPNATTAQLSRTGGLNGTPTHFTVHARYIYESIGNGTPLPFFVKGVDYSPTPIGKGVADPPLLNDPLRDGNEAIWSRDLGPMRTIGVNAIHVYNVVPPPYDKDTGPISKFLTAAWNNGTNPIYVIITIHFPGSALKNRGAANDLAKQYYDMDKKYASYPAVMGVAISNEILAENFFNDREWWDNFNVVASRAKQGFVDGGNGSKIVTTSEVDSFFAVGKYGEKYGAKVDAYGVNIYRGRTLTNLFDEIKDVTTKPVMLTEYGATAAYHPAWGNTYEYPRDLHGIGHCLPTTRDGPNDRGVRELPDKGNPKMAGLIDYATNNATLLYDGYKNHGGVVSGGFYFEWTDEWWKADNGANPEYRGKHVGTIDAFRGHFPGCNEDAAWFGLNSISKGAGDVDKITPRPTRKALRELWATQN